MEDKKITLIGCGMVGQLIATELSADFYVTVMDNNQKNLDQLNHFRGKKLLGDANQIIDLKRATEEAHLVVLAVPGFLGYEVLNNLLELGKNVVDISFFSENAQLLSAVAQKNNCFALVDCGIAPGFSHLAAGFYAHKNLKQYKIYVGGLPFEKTPPFAYKAPFSPIDVIEEYTRPARFIKNGHQVTQAALTEYELLEFEKIGLLEAFVSDGLRSLIFNYPQIDYMIEKTLRHPGHAAAIKVLLDGGFLNDSGSEPTPLAFNLKILFDQWKLKPEDDEFTLMKLELMAENWKKTITVFDRKDFDTGFSSMARTTGYTCCAVVRKALESNFNNIGIFEPEILAEKHDFYPFVKNYLIKKGISIEES